MSEDYSYVVEEHGISRHHNRPPFDMVKRTEYDELPDEVQSDVASSAAHALAALPPHAMIIRAVFCRVSTPIDASEYDDEDGFRMRCLPLTR